MRAYLLALIVLSLTLFSHILGIQGFYVMYSVYDIFMHILGGVGIAIFVFALSGTFKTGFFQNKRRAVLIGTLLAGIVWEAFEIVFNVAGHPLWTLPYYLDTAKDLLDDMIGAGLVTLFIKD